MAIYKVHFIEKCFDNYRDTEFSFKNHHTVSARSQEEAIEVAKGELIARKQYSCYDESAKRVGNNVWYFTEGICSAILSDFRAEYITSEWWG